MTAPLIRIFSLFIALTFISFLPPAYAKDPMNDVFSLMKDGGGTRSGKNKVDGYYIVAMGMSSRSSETKAYEEARMDSLRQLTEMIHGITMSGSTSASMKYITVSKDGKKSEFSSEKFVDTVNSSFKGQLSAAKMIKKGKYKGDYFVAIVITQSDIKNSGSLKGNNSNGNSGGGNSTVIISTNASNESIATFSKGSKSVEAKGLASMKNGESKARELALQDAMRNAVQQAQGVMVQGKSGTFGDALAVALETKTEGYVKNYEILDEDMERGSYYVIIQAEVDANKLLNDVNFYLNVFSQPIFTIESENKQKSAWVTDELQRLGFAINDGKTQATHTFYLKQSQQEIEDHKGKKGIQTSLTISLKDITSGEVIFSVMNNPLKTRITVKPISRAKQVSEVVAYKQMKKKLGIEVIQSMVRYSEKGIVYKIVLNGAKKTDVDIFKHVLNNGTSGQVESWDWDKKGKKMVLNYRFKGALSEAFDQGLKEIYSTFKKEGKGRRPHMKKVGKREAIFDIVRKR